MYRVHIILYLKFQDSRIYAISEQFLKCIMVLQFRSYLRHYKQPSGLIKFHTNYILLALNLIYIMLFILNSQFIIPPTPLIVVQNLPLESSITHRLKRFRYTYCITNAQFITIENIMSMIAHDSSLLYLMKHPSQRPAPVLCLCSVSRALLIHSLALFSELGFSSLVLIHLMFNIYALF